MLTVNSRKEKGQREGDKNTIQNYKKVGRGERRGSGVS
jgi:hypothetical protein